MSGNREGGLRAAQTNKQRYGDEYYHMIGRAGGVKGGAGKGFSSEVRGADGLTGRERARVVGAIGGKMFRKKPLAQS